MGETLDGSKNAKKRITVLGATGSIGKSVFDLVSRDPERYEVVALVANKNVKLLASMAIKTNATLAVVADPSYYDQLVSCLEGSGIEAAAGDAAVLEAVDRDTDIVIGAIVGAAGLRPTIHAIRAGRRLALANKECLVCAGELFMHKVKHTGAELLPVDSEHNAIFQVFENDKADQVEKVILTASGGPFRTFSKEQIADVSPEQALKHPNWEMGQRITIDSATMMNKGFELIEAFHLFEIDRHQLGVLVHPESVVHGLVQYKDGSLLAQLGSPDMRGPIGYCLSYPKREPAPVEHLDLAQIATLHFEKPDYDRFPCLQLALDALGAGGGAPAILNAVDEIAVAAFLSRQIGFCDIPKTIEKVWSQMESKGLLKAPNSLEAVLEIDAEARKRSLDFIN